MLLESSDRRGERFEQVLKSDKRKFFIMCKLIKSHKAAKKAEATGNKHSTHMFNVLQKEKCTNLELLGTKVIYEHPSKAKGGKKPKVELLNTLSRTKGQSSLIAFDFHGVGGCTGFRMKNKKDETALCKLIRNGRTFELAGDPLADSKVGKKRPLGAPDSRPKKDLGPTYNDKNNGNDNDEENKMSSLGWNRCSLHLFPLSHPLILKINGS